MKNSPIAHSPRALADQLISKRKQLKLSQAKVARLVGLKQQTISAFELKPEGTKLETLFRILSACDCLLVLHDKQSTDQRQADWTEEW